MKTDNMIFVFAKDKEVECFSRDDLSTDQKKWLEIKGFKHTATLKPTTLIEYIANCKDDKEILKIIKDLRK